MLEVIFILDKSGSMHGLEKDSIGGFNNMLDKQRKQKEAVLVSTVLFNTESEVIHDRINIKEIKDLTIEDYTVEGCTALLDALGDAIKHISTVHKYARKEDLPKKTLMVIMTDGYENASKRYSYDDIYQLISAKKEMGWEFIFMGANIDAQMEASKFGIDKEYSVNYHADSQGTQVNFDAVNAGIDNLRTSGTVGKTWRKCIDKDYKSRK